ncbi:MAG: hypothetical protein PHE79_04935 [Eubacteriales bacterium]|nr:hypothetical protein [Eubacteriales bacterium]
MKIYEYLLKCDKEEFVSTLTEMTLASTFSNFYELMTMMGVVKGDDEEQFRKTVDVIQNKLDKEPDLKRPTREMVEIMLNAEYEEAEE